MKNLVKISLILIVALGFSMNSFAQASASATAVTNATIVTPLSISNTVALDFGNVAVAAGTGGTVVISPAGVRSTTGSVTLPSTTGTVTAASFTITGSTNYTYAITLPGTVTIDDGGGNDMDVNTFTSTPSGTGQLTAGSQTLTVGATLNVSAGQTAGSYTHANDLEVTVVYN